MFYTGGVKTILKILAKKKTQKAPIVMMAIFFLNSLSGNFKI